MDGSILTLNAGSSSLKFALYDADLATTMHGAITGIGTQPCLEVRDPEGQVLTRRDWSGFAHPPLDDLLGAVLDFTGERGGRTRIAAVGHRVVQGGADHIRPAIITPELRADLQRMIDLAPLHMPAILAAMDAVADDRPGLMQVACFDTAFHATQPPIATHFALPRAITEAGVRRYGFHGLSYEFIALRLAALNPAVAQGRVIAAHLGAGASLCAMQAGRSIATTMGFTALDGLMMATRCGSIDAGVVLHLARQGRSFAEIEDLLYRRSGLLGVSGISGDVRTLLASADPHAAEAIELFTYRIAIEAGGLVSALGGLDGLVFAAGIGEHAPPIRAAICRRLAWLGIRLDEDANAQGAPVISTKASAVEVRIVATDEEAMIARHTQAILTGVET
jgi:acetate kinase